MTWKRFTRFWLFVRETTDLITQMPEMRAFTLSLSLALTSWVTTSQDAGYIHKTPYHTCDVTIFYFLTDEDINRGENILPSLLWCHIDTHECHMGVTAIHRKLFLDLFRLSLTTTIIIWGWGYCHVMHPSMPFTTARYIWSGLLVLTYHFQFSCAEGRSEKRTDTFPCVIF